MCVCVNQVCMHGGDEENSWPVNMKVFRLAQCRAATLLTKIIQIFYLRLSVKYIFFSLFGQTGTPRQNLSRACLFSMIMLIKLRSAQSGAVGGSLSVKICVGFVCSV